MNPSALNSLQTGDQRLRGVVLKVNKLRTGSPEVAKNVLSNQSNAFLHGLLCAGTCPAERWSLYDKAEQGFLSLQTVLAAAERESQKVHKKPITRR